MTATTNNALGSAGHGAQVEEEKRADLARLRAEGEALDPAWRPWKDARYTERLFSEQYAEEEREMRLHDAAPELLEALLEIVNDPYVERLGSLKLRALRVIAKATGEDV